jgi:3-phenylpropionate/trans-cinnamate dioxygenase ferredoxin subunit
MMLDYHKVDQESLDYLDICPLDEIKSGERVYFEVNRRPVVLINIAGMLYAIGDVCSHDNGPVGDGEIQGKEIICPRHGARFDLESGKAVRLPAVVDIPAYPVRVVAGMIQIGVPKQ